jgi:TonB family protein
VEAAKVAKGNAVFSASALAAVKQWKFQPLEKDGKPVKMTTTIAFNFTTAD